MSRYKEPMSRRDKILWSVAGLLGAVLIAISTVTILARTGGMRHIATVSAKDPWVQTTETNYRNEPYEIYFYTCPNTGAKEGTVTLRTGGLWEAESEHSPEHSWQSLEDKYRTKEQAQLAIEQFVAEYDMCDRHR